MIELLVALTITMIGLAGTMSLFTTTARANRNISVTSEAVEICEETAEEVRGFSVDTLETVLGYGAITTTGWGAVAYHGGDAQGSRGTTYRRTIEASELPDNSNLIWMRVNVVWGEQGADIDANPELAKTVSLEFVRSRLEVL